MNTQVWVRQDEIINKPDKANTFRQVKNLHAVLARLLCKIWHILQQESCSLYWSVSCNNLTIYFSTGKLTKSKSMQPSDVAYMSASCIGRLCDNRVPQMRTDR